MNYLWIFSVVVIGVFFAPWSLMAASQPPQPGLGLPVDCQPGKDCWLVNLVDLDPTSAVRDYMCRRQSYDGHIGTDLAIRDLSVMAKGVNVLASWPGRVVGARDGMKDIDVKIIGRDAVKGRECGNGVLIKHTGGWTTQYCHMKKSSVKVAQGDVITRGQVLGLIGNSGLAQFPHVHIVVRHQGVVVDPFQGEIENKQCTIDNAPLWSAEAARQLKKANPGPFNAGFSAIRPNDEAIRQGLYQDKTLPKKSPALIFWTDIYWPRAGDELSVRLRGPDGKIIAAQTKIIEKTRARQMVYIGKKRKQLFWDKGLYRGEVVLKRKNNDGPIIAQSLNRTLEIK